MNDMQDTPKKTRKTKETPAAPPAPPKFRDEKGLLSGIDYVFDQYGFVNWRAMVNPEHIVLNRQAMAKDGVDTKTLTKEQTAEYLATVSDDKKLIKLAGFRELVKLRGARDVYQSVTESNGVVYATCAISFLPNIDTDYQEFTYQAVASASIADVAPNFSHFLAAIASNRAFGRCVREALNIFVVSEEEMNPNEEVKVSEPPAKPLELVRQKCQEKGIEFATLKKELEGRGLSNPSWVSFETLGIEAAYPALESIKSLT